MSQEEDVQQGKFLVKGGFQSQDNTNTQNLHQALDYTQQPITNFTLALNGQVVLISGIISSSTYENAVVALTAKQKCDGDVCLRVDTQGAPLDLSTAGQSPVDGSGAKVLPANPNRKYALIQNTSTSGEIISLAIKNGGPAVLYSGITLYPQGSYEMSFAQGNLSTDDVYAICSAASGRIAVLEGV